MAEAGLKDKICVITGGSGVIGSALCKGLAREGADIAIIGRNEVKMEKLSVELSEIYQIRAIGIKADVLDRKALEKARTIIREKLGTPDVLVNCAGGNHPGATSKTEEYIPGESDASDSFFGLEEKAFDNTLALNFKGTLLPTLVFAEAMTERKHGSIINISSMSSFQPMTKVAAYSAAKAAINNFTYWLAVHFGKTGVRVNAVAPGFFITAQNSFLLLDDETGGLTERGKKIIKNTPMGRFGEVEEIAGAVNYLASDEARFVTGIVLPVDGGFSAFSGV